MKFDRRPFRIAEPSQFTPEKSKYDLETRRLVATHAFDAHLDFPGQGGWGSVEQLQKTHRIGGALRVYFCERDGKAPETVDEQMAEMRGLDPLLAIAAPSRQDPRHIEGCESVRGVDDLYNFFEQITNIDIKSVGPIYHANNQLGGSSREPGVGLTDLGKKFVNLAWGKKMNIDLAHMSHQSMQDVFRMASFSPSPIYYTHGGVQHDGITHSLLLNGNMERSLSPELAEVLVSKGRFIGLSPCVPFYNTPETFFEHMMWLGEESCWEHVGIGTDYGGILDQWRWPGCETVFDLFCFVTHELLKRGLTEQQVAGIIGDNFRRHLGLL